MASTKGTIKRLVSDKGFGFVAAQDGGGQSYLAPEARRAPDGLDRRADIFSLAVIAAEMLTGSVPDRDPVKWSEVSRALPPRDRSRSASYQW